MGAKLNTLFSSGVSGCGFVGTGGDSDVRRFLLAFCGPNESGSFVSTIQKKWPRGCIREVSFITLELGPLMCFKYPPVLRNL